MSVSERLIERATLTDQFRREVAWTLSVALRDPERVAALTDDLVRQVEGLPDDVFVGYFSARNLVETCCGCILMGERDRRRLN